MRLKLKREKPSIKERRPRADFLLIPGVDSKNKIDSIDYILIIEASATSTAKSDVFHLVDSSSLPEHIHPNYNRHGFCHIIVAYSPGGIIPMPTHFWPREIPGISLSNGNG